MGVEQSDTEVANRALAMLGVTLRVDNLQTNETPHGVAMRHAFPALWRALLQEYPWNWAGGRASLPALAEKPAFEFAYAYAPPSDFLSLRDIHGYPNERYSLEANDAHEPVILTDIGPPLALRYGRLITTVGRAPQVWIEAFIPRLAAVTAMTATNIDSDPANAWDVYRQMLATAQDWDATTNDPGRIADGPMVEDRHGSS